MFRKPKRNFRRKVEESDSDKEKEDADEDTKVEAMEVTESGDQPIKIVKKKKSKGENKSSSKTLLSFQDEEEEETFKVKKSSHSKRIAKQLKKESQREQVSIKEEESPSNGSINQAPEEVQVYNGEDVKLESSESEEDIDTQQRQTFQAILARGEIPDAKMIHFIRKRRQLARDMENEFIPIEDNTKKQETTTSRLIREEDNDRSDDDDERMDFSINARERDRQKMKDDFLAAEHGSDHGGSDQERKWEEQQLRKAAAIPAQISSTSSNTTDNLYNQYQQLTLNQGVGSVRSYGAEYSTDYAANSKTAQPFIPFSKVNSAEVTIEVIKKRLQERLDSMDEVHRSHLREHEKLVSDLSDTETSIETCDKKSAGLEEQFRFFQEMRGYVRDLVDCLSEKVPTINSMEHRMLNILQHRTQRLVSRRQQDVRDQCQDYTSSKSTSQIVQDEEASERQMRVAEREARRSRRRRAREVKNIVGHFDGLSSDEEESKSDIIRYKVEHGNIMKISDSLFEDVIEDFSSMSSIRDRFQDWKLQYSASYKEAYIALCLPKLCNPLIRLQLIDWNPLEADCKDFEESNWYASLMFYSFNKEDSVVDRDDDDIKLLPVIVEKVVIPKITNLVEKVWDPLSTPESSRLVNLIQKLFRDYPTINSEQKGTKNLLKAIVMRMKQTLDDDVFVPLYPKNVTDNRSSGASLFFHRQMWSCIKVLGNFLSWHEIITDKSIQQLAVAGLLNRYILMGLQMSAVNKDSIKKCQVIVSTFPRLWFADIDGDKTIPQLENLCRYLAHAADALDQIAFIGTDAEKKETRELIKQIAKIFVNVHAIDHAVNLSNQYSINI